MTLGKHPSSLSSRQTERGSHATLQQTQNISVETDGFLSKIPNFNISTIKGQLFKLK